MLVVDNLAVARGDRRLAENLSFKVAPGEALIVTGRNGTGKSTLLRVLAGLLRPAGGCVGWQTGRRCEGGNEDDAGIAARAHYLGHANSLKSALTATENLAFWAALLALPDAPDACSPAQALARLDLGRIADLPVSFLSAGQKRRVALARLLVAIRPLWLVDEPTTALDAPAQMRFGDLMREHLASGGSIVAATHAPLGLASARELHLGAPQ